MEDNIKENRKMLIMNNQERTNLRLKNSYFIICSIIITVLNMWHQKEHDQKGKKKEIHTYKKINRKY